MDWSCDGRGELTKVCARPLMVAPTAENAVPIRLRTVLMRAWMTPTTLPRAALMAPKMEAMREPS